MTEYYLVRHGQTQAGAQGVVSGTLDTPLTYLNETGKAQMQALKQQLNLTGSQRIIASPLSRTQQAAELLNATAQLPLDTDQRLQDISYGRWNGHTRKQLQQTYPELFDPYSGEAYADYAIPAKGEVFSAVNDRLRSFMTETTRRYPKAKLLVVTHGFIIQALAAAAVQAATPLAFPQPATGSVTQVVCSPDTMRQYLLNYNQRYSNQA